jgi:S1-C subfamily serine protease
VRRRRSTTLLAAPLVLAVLLGAAACKDDTEPAPTATAAEAPPAASTRTAAGATAPPPSGGAPARAEGFGDIPGLVARVEPSVVAVQVRTPGGRAEGSGVIWNADGVIVTNNHVVEGATEVTVAFASGQRSAAEVVDADPLTDIAVLRVSRKGLPAATFAGDLPEVGELALAIGNPLGFESTVTAGIVSGLHRSIPGDSRETASLVDLIQTDAAISPGNSGGALVGPAGEVIGINVAYIPPQDSAVSIGFAIPADTVASVVEQLLGGGGVQHSYLGIVPATLTPEVADRFDIGVDAGVVVMSVSDDSPAGRAGLEPGDIIVRSGATRLDSAGDLLGLLRRVSPGDRLELTVVRDGEERTVTARLEDRPAALGGG